MYYYNHVLANVSAQNHFNIVPKQGQDNISHEVQKIFQVYFKV